MVVGRRTVGAFFCSMLILALGASCSFKYGDEAPDAKRLPDAVFSGFLREEMTDGKVSFRAKADRAEYFSADHQFVITGLSFEDIDTATGLARASGRAGKAVYYEDSGDAEISGGITLFSREEDATFQTESLQYLGASHTLEGGLDNEVLIRVGTRLVVQGTGFFADVDGKIFSLRDRVSGRVQQE